MCHSQRSEVPVACRGHLETLVLSWEKQPLDILSSITKEILNNNKCENILFLFDHWCRKPGCIIKSHEERKHVEANNGKIGHLRCTLKLSATAFTKIRKGNETKSFDQLCSEVSIQQQSVPPWALKLLVCCVYVRQFWFLIGFGKHFQQRFPNNNNKVAFYLQTEALSLKTDPLCPFSKY